uniref:Thioredoxin domain-containing protein n=2 Tax=Florenciella parvula TaxID=236787 RepID=A0A7S2C1Y2_9STRA
MAKVVVALLMMGSATAFKPMATPRLSRRTAALNMAGVAYPENAERIKVGDAAPAVGLTKAEDDVDDTTVSGLFGKGTSVLVNVPGAFTPTCSNTHVTGYLENLAGLEAEGVDNVYIMAVNDRFVMKAWDDSLELDSFREAKIKPELIADGAGTISASMGLLVDKGDMGGRAIRSAVVFKDGVAKYVGVDAGQPEASSAETIMGMLKKEREDAEAAKAAAEAEAKAAAEAAAAEAKAAEVLEGEVDQKQALIGIAVAAAAAYAAYGQSVTPM